MPLPTGTPPPIGPRGLAIRCALQGQDARHAGAPLNGCPYGPDRPYSRRAWLAGYIAVARDLGDRLPEDTVDATDDTAPTPTP